MEILFGQHFDKGYYLDYSLPENQHIFNKQVVGPLGLLNLLEREMGLKSKNLQFLERRIVYQEILGDYFQVHIGNLFEKSFSNDPNGVAVELLRYRDQLILAGWNKTISGISTKVDFLASIENKYHVPDGVENRLIHALAILISDLEISLDFKTISLAEEIRNLHPFYGQLFAALATKGIIVKPIGFNTVINLQTNLGKIKAALLDKSSDIKLDDKEKTSLQIIRFKTDVDAAEFLSSQHEVLKDTVIFNRNNSLFDEMLNSFGLPVSGSKQVKANPMIIQLVKLIAALLVKPLHIHNLMSYLQVDINPVPATLRYALMKVLKETGGVNNSEWNNLIEDFKFNDAAHKQEIQNFLNICESDKNNVNRLDATRLYHSLELWSQKRLILIQNDPSVSSQLMYLIDMCKAVIGVLDAKTGEFISSSELGLIISGVYEPNDFTNYETQVGACSVFSVPGQLIDSPKNCVWLDCYNEEMKPTWYSFLNSIEIDRLKAQNVIIWDTAEQTRATSESLLMGLLMPHERCVLVLSEKANDEPVSDHPVYSFLKASIPAIENFILDAFMLTEANLNELGWVNPTVQSLNASALPEKKLVHQITKGNLIPERPTESASSIGLLVQSPFDWVLQYGAKIQPANSYQLDDVATTKGNVAHKLIEMLFKEAENDLLKAKMLMTGYDAFLQKTAEGYGMLLLLDENRFEYERFRTSLLHAVDTLFQIIDKNGLKVTGTESKLTAELPTLNNLSVRGFIDLILETPDGKKAIFDLKWSRKPQNYVQRMKENKHIQLAIYKELLEAAEKNIVDFVAYFSLSNSCLITASHLVGDHILTLSGIKDETEILKSVQNSIVYRNAQFQQGIIEEGEELDLTSFDYYNDQYDKNLIQLDMDKKKKVKKVNYYSSFKVFKGDII